MPFQQRAQLVLKSNLAVMLLLSGKEFLHIRQLRLAHGERRAAALPFEVGVIATALLQPEVRDTLQVSARNALNESIYATPAIVEDKLYVRCK